MAYMEMQKQQHRRKLKSPELLAPAGSLEKLKFAVTAGRRGNGTTMGRTGKERDRPMQPPLPRPKAPRGPKSIAFATPAFSVEP